MAIPTISTNLAQNQDIWNSLKQAIAKSSGFKRWQKENQLEGNESNIEDLVKQYLRSTLEAMAY